MIKNSDRGGYTKTKGIDEKICLSLVSHNNPEQKRRYEFNLQPENKIPKDGRYRIYEIDKEPNLSQGLHIELLFTRSKWQGFLIL
ncbi:MAG: hypothetical protein ABIO02_03395, partial [Patescibacteria group bacterium]